MSIDQKSAKIVIKAATMEDLKFSLINGVRDFRRYPAMSMFFGFVYVVTGYLIVYGLFYTGQIWLTIPLIIGFPLIAPFIAAGLYDISRRLESEQNITFGEVLLVVWEQRTRELGWMAFTVLFIFWIWVYQVRLLLAIFLSRLSFSSFERFTDIVFYTSQGWGFLAIGTIVGAGLFVILFSVTVIGMPILLDREIDFVTAMITSVKTVLQSPLVMLLWGAAIGLILIVSMIPAFLGLLISLPILGHSTWHLYRRLISTS